MCAGNCYIEGPCIRSPRYLIDQQYPNNDVCEFLPTPNVAIYVPAFFVEETNDDGLCTWDFLVIENIRYCHHTGPDDVVPTDAPIVWIADSGVADTGWEICQIAPPSVPPPPFAPPPPSLPPYTPGLCTDSCATANNGNCEDGGPFSEWNTCPAGTDCSEYAQWKSNGSLQRTARRP